MDEGEGQSGPLTTSFKVTGYLQKKSEKLKRWNNRYFDFDGGVLSWAKITAKDQETSKRLGAVRVMRVAEVPERKNCRAFR